MVVVIAEAQAVLGGDRGALVQPIGERPHPAGVGPVRRVPVGIDEVLHADGLGGLEHGGEVHLAEEGLVGAREVERQLAAGAHQRVAVLEQVEGLGMGEAEVDQATERAEVVLGELLAHAVELDGDLHGVLSGERGRGGHFTAPAVRPATKFFCIIRKPTTTGIDTAIEAARIWFQ